MPDWAIALAIALLSATAAIVLREILEWFRRPKLSIDFEEFHQSKPYIHDLTIERDTRGILIGSRDPDKTKVLRLIVNNVGGRAAFGCEAKMTVYKEEKEDPASHILLHWARRDKLVYRETDQQFAPITINRRGGEPLDLLRLDYHSSNGAPEPYILSVSPRVYLFDRNVKYLVAVTIYGENTTHGPVEIPLEWDGTLQGFDVAVSHFNLPGNWLSKATSCVCLLLHRKPRNRA